MNDPAMEPPIDQGVAMIEAVENCRALAVDHAVGAVYETLGASLARFGDRGEQCCREDIHRHIDYITGALIAGRPELFGRYTLWLKEILAVRGVSPDSLSLSLTALREFLDAHLAEAFQETAHKVLDRGEEALAEGQSAYTPLGAIADPEDYNPAYEDLAQALLNGNKPQAMYIIRQVASEHGYLDMLIGLVQPAMYRVGERWKTLEISVAEEHMATAMAQRLTMYELRQASPATCHGRKAMFACVETNLHSFGLRMVADAFELDGWDVQYLGPNVPTADLVTQALTFRPEIVGLSVGLVQQLPVLKQAVDRLHAESELAQTRIIAGGGGLASVPGLAGRLRVDRWYSHARAARERHAAEPE